jgi:hypothetical protein
MKQNLEEKKIFLIACAHPDKTRWFEKTIMQHIGGAKVFSSQDGLDATSKLSNFPPHVLIADIELAKTAPWKLIEHAITSRKTMETAVIVNGLPAVGRFMDEMVTGRIQYFCAENGESEFAHLLAKALNFSSHKEPAEFYLKFLAAGDPLIKEGDKADSVFFVKKGQLKAHRGDAILGKIDIGEFVGEMAYINGEPRSASVTAVSDCELIEVPIGTFESVLFKRPSWSKALMMTLAKRIKVANLAASKN